MLTSGGITTGEHHPFHSKVLEDFVVTWMFEDVGDYIDARQFG